VCAFAGHGGVELYQLNFVSGTEPPVNPVEFRTLWTSNFTAAYGDPQNLVHVNDVIIIPHTNYMLASETTYTGIIRWDFKDPADLSLTVDRYSISNIKPTEDRPQRISHMVYIPDTTWFLNSF
jgi:hypothetical protein